MIQPAISYNNGSPQTFNFLYPPTSKPLLDLLATRTDTFSTDGVRQTVVQRVNQQFPIQMDTILQGDDSNNWSTFLAWAVQGNNFTFIPDNTNPNISFLCFMVETNAQLAYSSPGVYTLTCTFQVEITS